MRIIYHAANIIDANLVKDALEHEGMRAFVNGEYLTGGIGQLPAFDLINVMVADGDVERAQTLVRRIDAGRAQAPAEAAERATEDGTPTGLDGLPA